MKEHTTIDVSGRLLTGPRLAGYPVFAENVLSDDDYIHRINQEVFFVLTATV